MEEGSNPLLLPERFRKPRAGRCVAAASSGVSPGAGSGVIGEDGVIETEDFPSPEPMVMGLGPEPLPGLFRNLAVASLIAA